MTLNKSQIRAMRSAEAGKLTQSWVNGKEGSAMKGGSKQAVWYLVHAQMLEALNMGPNTLGFRPTALAEANRDAWAAI